MTEAVAEVSVSDLRLKLQGQLKELSAKRKAKVKHTRAQQSQLACSASVWSVLSPQIAALERSGSTESSLGTAGRTSV